MNLDSDVNTKSDYESLTLGPGYTGVTPYYVQIYTVVNC